MRSNRKNSTRRRDGTGDSAQSALSTSGKTPPGRKTQTTPDTDHARLDEGGVMENLLAETNVIPCQQPEATTDLEPAAVPISFDDLQTPDDKLHRNKPEAPNVTESISPFPAVLVEKNEYRSLISFLQYLRTARTVYDKRRMFHHAKDIAPDDPRVWYLFSAAFGFSPEVRSELLQAVELSDAHYSQPFRQLIECHLAEIKENGASSADQAIALLSDFVVRISKQDVSGDRLYDWEWIGRVIGYLEVEAYRDPQIAGMLNASVPRIRSMTNSVGIEHIQNGRRFALNATNSTESSTVFPKQPQIGFALCLRSFVESKESPSTKSSSALAKRLK